MANRIAPLGHLALSVLSTPKQRLPPYLAALGDNLVLLRKIANNYPEGTFHFISYVVESEKWYLLDLLEDRAEYDFTSFSLGRLLENSHTKAGVSESVIERIDMVYALTGLLDLKDVYGCYHGANTNMWGGNEDLFDSVEACIEDGRPFCITSSGMVTTIEEKYPEIEVLVFSENGVEYCRHLIRLHMMLKCCERSVMELHKLPDGSPFPVRDGESFVREMIVRFHLEPECLEGVRRYYYQSILRGMGLKGEYADIFMSYVSPSSASQEKFTEVLDELRRELDSIEQGNESGWSGLILAAFVAAECPEKVGVLYKARMRVVQRQMDHHVYNFVMRGMFGEYSIWGELPHHDVIARALIAMEEKQE
jgi:hypothetical protein